ncbi:hypothetical protein HUG10_07960 [Halorarum halophilum]|uniref:Uncharacterized protein n=1 Tax=Halorarum halophilum TaxID=2743090 RepID=A0A7D5GF76_9EURY|nr:hypothetical protein [Halobaculum halophilum]QLG27490.1 hypothetical protein HUG10_07960 [Halobaculum halophilum]
MESDRFEFTNSPVQTGALIGILVGVVQSFIFPVEFSAATFLLVGIVLVLFGDRSWPDVGRALISLTIATSIVAILYRLIFGGPWF